MFAGVFLVLLAKLPQSGKHFVMLIKESIMLLTVMNATKKYSDEKSAIEYRGEIQKKRKKTSNYENFEN